MNDFPSKEQRDELRETCTCSLEEFLALLDMIDHLEETNTFLEQTIDRLQDPNDLEHRMIKFLDKTL